MPRTLAVREERVHDGAQQKPPPLRPSYSCGGGHGAVPAALRISFFPGLGGELGAGAGACRLLSVEVRQPRGPALRGPLRREMRASHPVTRRAALQEVRTRL